jgi:hypothetical protein
MNSVSHKATKIWCASGIDDCTMITNITAIAPQGNSADIHLTVVGATGSYDYETLADGFYTMPCSE